MALGTLGWPQEHGDGPGDMGIALRTLGGPRGHWDELGNVGVTLRSQGWLRGNRDGPRYVLLLQLQTHTGAEGTKVPCRQVPEAWPCPLGCSPPYTCRKGGGSVQFWGPVPSTPSFLLQFLHSRGQKDLSVQMVQTMRIGLKDQNKGLFSIWQEIFQLPRLQR